MRTNGDASSSCIYSTTCRLRLFLSLFVLVIMHDDEQKTKKSGSLDDVLVSHQPPRRRERDDEDTHAYAHTHTHTRLMHEYYNGMYSFTL
jgi:hypothetical protein